MKVKDILKNKGAHYHSIGPDAAVRDALNKIVDEKIGSLLVMQGGNLVGIITERDILRLLHQKGDKGLSIKVSHSMTTDIIIGLADDDVEIVEAVMTNNRFRHLPIMEGNRVVGIVSIGDVIKSHTTNLEIENRYLKDYITGKYPG